ncbi:MAG: hypothetical protein ACI808_002186, partial [Paraglaciecola sp.]
AGVRADYIEHHSGYGHDALLGRLGVTQCLLFS